MMKCELTTKVRSRSALMPARETAPIGTVRPCDCLAIRRCPSCRRVCCANHSRSLSTMGGKLENSQRHRCGGCGTVAHFREWLPIGRAS